MKQAYGNKEPIILAHRGAPYQTKENSVAAFTAASDAGFTYLETDVRLGEDGVIYLRHDASSHLPNQLLKVKPGDQAASLAELLDACPDSCIAIDPKHEKVVIPLAQLIARAGAAHRVCIGSSFDGRAEATAHLVDNLTGHRPQVARVSALSIIKLLCNAYVAGRFKLGEADYIHVPNRLVSPAVIKAAHARNLGIIAWVVNDEQRLQTLLSWGVDGVMTDNPRLVKTASSDAV